MDAFPKVAVTCLHLMEKVSALKSNIVVLPVPQMTDVMLICETWKSAAPVRELVPGQCAGCHIGFV